jgi:hypothetical protein
MKTPYTASTERLMATGDELRSRIPGWGVDLDPGDRPSFPRERLDLELPLGGARPGADGIPERQPETWPRERSIEHEMLTPVFGTSTPPKGLRKMAYAKYSEGRAAHWLLLVAADRVDAWEAHLRSFATLRPDNPITETGIRAEFTSKGWSSRFGQRRADVVHQPLDAAIVAGPWVVGAGVAVAGMRRMARAVRSRGAA